jgi:hypothetical protein
MFVANMEDVLEVYHQSYDEKRPVICKDEQPVQLREPLPMNERHSEQKTRIKIRRVCPQGNL